MSAEGVNSKECKGREQLVLKKVRSRYSDIIRVQILTV